MRVAAHHHRAQVGRQALFLAGGDDEDARGQHALAGDLQFAATELVGVVDEQHRLGVLAVVGQGFGALVLLEGFPRGAGVVGVVGGFFLALGFPPVADSFGIAPGRQGAEAVEHERGSLDLAAPDFRGGFVQALYPAAFAGVVRTRDQDRALGGNGFFAEGVALLAAFGDK